MNYLEFIVAILEALAWPSAIILAAWILLPHLRPLLPRLRKAGPAGVEFFPQDQQKDVSPDKAKSELSDVKLEPFQDEHAAECQSRRKKGPFAGVKVGQLRCRALLGVLPIKLTRDKAHVGQRPTSIKFRPGSGSGVSALF